MLKVVTPREMSRIENLAYKEGYSEDDFMNHAGSSVADIAEHYIILHGVGIYDLLLLCGKGNNGGDAYVAGKELMDKGYSVTALQIGSTLEMSPLCKKNQESFLLAGGHLIPLDELSPQLFLHYDLIIDGIFGTGFHGATASPYDRVIELANASKLPIISVDIPSGLNGETGAVEGNAINATVTVYLELPKLGFFLQNGWNHIGKLERGRFGLADRFVEQAAASFLLLETSDLSLPPIVPDRHKYQAGSVVGLAGSTKMPGAALLSSLAALRGGAGMMRLLHPEGTEVVLSASPYELIKIPYRYDAVDEILALMNKANAVFVGPGIGLTNETETLIKKLLSEIKVPCVVDADALTILAKSFSKIPAQTILTPHLGEMSRLLNCASPPHVNIDFLKECKNFSQAREVTLILKGAPSFVFHPDKDTVISTYGNPGMATAGSGDVLTGLLASLLAQHMAPQKAAILGVALHGIAGQFAAEALTPYNMIASDIINNFHLAYRSLK